MKNKFAIFGSLINYNQATIDNFDNYYTFNLRTIGTIFAKK